MRTLALMTLSAVAAAAGGALLTASGGQGQDRPGQIGQARVFIENQRSRNEAVPIVLEEVATRTPLGVQIVGTPTVTLPAATVVNARRASQRWDYRTLNVAADQDPARALTTAGADGWELAGVIPNASGSSLILKRPLP